MYAIRSYYGFFRRSLRGRWRVALRQGRDAGRIAQNEELQTDRFEVIQEKPEGETGIARFEPEQLHGLVVEATVQLDVKGQRSAGREDVITSYSIHYTKLYDTACIGKWHLGLGNPPETDFTRELSPGPLDLGFDVATWARERLVDGAGEFTFTVFCYPINQTSLYLQAVSYNFV